MATPATYTFSFTKEQNTNFLTLHGQWAKNCGLEITEQTKKNFLFELLRTWEHRNTASSAANNQNLPAQGEADKKLITEIDTLRGQIAALNAEVRVANEKIAVRESAGEIAVQRVKELTAENQELKARQTTDENAVQSQIEELAQKLAACTEEKNSAIVLDVSTDEMQQFERATQRRIAAKLSASRENFISQMFMQLRLLASKEHLLNDKK